MMSNAGAVAFGAPAGAETRRLPGLRAFEGVSFRRTGDVESGASAWEREVVTVFDVLMLAGNNARRGTPRRDEV